MQSLRSIASDNNILLGAACRSELLFSDKTYRRVLAQEFNLTAPESELKIDTVCAKPKEFDYDRAFDIAALMKRWHVKMWGGCLVWHRSVPEWLKFQSDRALLVLSDYIANTLETFHGEIEGWDLLNEVLADDIGVLRQESFWYQHIGAEFPKLVFELARSLAPEAKLYINDYRLHYFPHKRRALLDLAEWVRADGIGIQFHHNLFPGLISSHWLGGFIKEARDRGFLVRLSEATIWANHQVPGWETLQGLAYAKLIKECLDNGCREICLWGVCDKYVWKHPDSRPWLLDGDYRPKEAYWKVMDAIAKKI